MEDDPAAAAELGAFLFSAESREETHPRENAPE